MALSIKDPETERLVRELAARKGTGVTGAIRLAVSNQLKSDGARQDSEVGRKCG
jgi:antitoxin VapB